MIGIVKKLRLANAYARVINSKARDDKPAKFINFNEHSPYLYSAVD
jgi:hypothetical protein